ncbi:MAG: hypothetical protein ACRCRV_07595 [Cetobacterium sp.]
MINYNFNEIDTKILLLLIHRKSIKLKDIFQEFTLSQSLVKKTLSKLDRNLTAMGFPSLHLTRGVYGILPENSKPIKKLLEINYKHSKDERIFHILFKLLQDKSLILAQESHLLNCNRKTLQLDLKEIRHFLKPFALTIHSLHGKHIQLRGTKEHFYYLFLRLMVKIILKRDIPFYKELYNKYFPKEKRDLYKALVSKINNLFSNKMGFKRYCGIAAIFSIYENFPHMLPKNRANPGKIGELLITLKEPLIMENLASIEYLLEEIHSDYFSSDDYKMHSNSYKFIVIFESVFCQIPSKYKMILYNLINESIFEKRFNLLENGDKETFKGSTLCQTDNFSNVIGNMLEFTNIDISLNGFYKILIFLRHLAKFEPIYKNRVYNSKVLILDGSLNLWMGTIIKEHLLKYYSFETLDLVYFLDSQDYSNYHLIFKLEVPENRVPKILEPITKLDWIEFFNNKNYFDQFNFKEI